MNIPLWVDGQPVQGTGDIARENPARPGEQVGTVRTADAALTGETVGAASAAFPGWAAVPVAERVTRVTDAIVETSAANGERGPLLSRELGKVIADVQGELGFALALARYDGPVAQRLCADKVLTDDEGTLITTVDPYGVIAAITPWNAPVILAALKVVPGLMTGNTMVVKPSPLAPLAVTDFLSQVARRLPAGVLNVVNGGADVGQALVGDPRVAKVSFTGGLTTARHIAATAAHHVRPTVMELGGNDAAIFLPDAEMDVETLQRAVFGSFLTSGQVCMAIKRLLVPAARRDEFVEAYLEAARRVLRVGDPLDPASTMGPVISREHQKRIDALVQSGRDAGGTVHDLGVYEPSSDDGYWVRPTLVLGLDDNHPLVADEQFGPTVPLLTYDSVDEAVARANSVEHGLASSVWSADEQRAVDVARRLDAGFSFINCHNRAGTSLRASFGGRRSSGHGREFGEAGVAEYVQTHSINSPAAIREKRALGNAYPVAG
ncbi:aldehyde dehydrogenase family protein [Actinoplanes sp. TRM 88003]|uniref:Aldehyde dehydrogenase family protein n=1 Tax=Paractinoplanes aksuensis TaxID=2939490 RepID=A0ABT1DE50_9ACTN|nr:aldehyde dehydrogenase family protein [Actinoplanes aksuensis]MCO8269092.1 aldehyde dehydrogenase family protein [Actinoplanes aksuensis]